MNHLLIRYFRRLSVIGVALLLLLAAPGALSRAASGQLDAFDWDPREEPLPLVGEWGMNWGELTPADQWQPPRAPWFEMPSTWDSSAGRQYPGVGYATFTLNVSHLSSRYEYALLIPELSTAFRLYVNERMVAEGGTVADQQAHAQPYSGNQLVMIPPPDRGQLRLKLQVSNFHHNNGGPWQAIALGQREMMVDDFFSVTVYEAIVAALMVIMAILLVLEYYVDPKDRSGLWLGLFALVLGVRLGITGYTPFYWLLDGQLPWELHMTIEYLCMLTAPMFFLYWIHACFPQDLSLRVVRLISFPFAISAITCLLLPTLYFSVLFDVFIYMLMITTVGGILLLLRISGRGREGAVLLLVGVLTLGIAVTHDILLNLQLILGAEWIAAGLLFFVLMQTSNLLNLRVKQRRQIEFLSTELANANQELESRVELRTRDLADKAQALERANNQLQVLANVDGLTGLLNRRAFLEQMQQLSDLSVRVALLWIDLDHFKRINDTYGHAAGDKVLKKFGHILRHLGRDQDRTGRLGGEEFALLLLDCDKAGAEHYAQRLQQSMKEMTFPDWPELQGITASIGIAIGRLGDDIWEELVRDADEAMYQVKHDGRNGYRFAE